MHIDIVCMQPNPLPVPESADRPAVAHVLALAAGLAAEGHDVLVHTRRDDPRCPDRARFDERVQVAYVPAGPPCPLGDRQAQRHVNEFTARLAGHWRRAAPQYVHAYDLIGGLATYLARREVPVTVVQSIRRLPHAGSLPAGEGRGEAARQARLRLKAALGSAANAVIVESHDDAERLGRLGLRRHSVHTIPRGIDPEPFRPERNARRCAGRPRLAYVCRTLPDEDLRTAVLALPTIPEAELVVVGGPSPRDLLADSAARDVIGLAVSVGVADRVRCTGRLGRSAVADVLRSSDIVLSLPRRAGFGTRILEAMACGVPVIATTHGGQADTLLHGTTGYHVPAGRPDELARRARALLRDDVIREAFGIAAVDRVRSRYSWPRIVRETLDVYERANVPPVPRCAQAAIPDDAPGAVPAAASSGDAAAG